MPVMIREVDGRRAPKDASQGHQRDVRFETLPVHMMLFHLIDALLFHSIDMIHISGVSSLSFGFLIWLGGR